MEHATLCKLIYGFLSYTLFRFVWPKLKTKHSSKNYSRCQHKSVLREKKQHQKFEIDRTLGNDFGIPLSVLMNT